MKYIKKFELLDWRNINADPNDYKNKFFVTGYDNNISVNLVTVN